MDQDRAGSPLFPSARHRHLVLLLVAVSIVARLLFLLYARSAMGFDWWDPDHYLPQAAALHTRTGAWHWTLRAVNYAWGGRVSTLPPGYPVFLSFFYRAGGNVFPVALVQIGLDGASVVAMYWLASALHTPRAGLIAAGIWAFSFSGVAGGNWILTEALHIPLLLLAFAMLGMCVVRRAGPGAFFAAGLVWAMATLVRAMPFYFLPIIALVVGVGSKSRRVPPRTLVAYLVGVLAPTLLYIAFISHARGHLVLIDDHAAVEVVATADGPTDVGGITVTESVQVMAHDLWTKFGTHWNLVRGAFHLPARSWLFQYTWNQDPVSARVTEWVVPLWLDPLCIAIGIAAPLGFCLARRRDLALILGAWAMFVIVLSSLAGLGGARYVVPAQIALICGASVVVAGGWARRSWWSLGAAGLVALWIATIVVPQIPVSLHAKASYGTSVHVEPGVAAEGRARSGFFVNVRDNGSNRGLLALSLEPTSGTTPMQFTIRASKDVTLTAVGSVGQPASIQVPMAEGLYFVEIVATRADATDDIRYRIVVPR